MKEQYNTIGGFQDSTLGQKLMFREEKGKFVQILHNGSLHCVVVTKIGSTDGKIRYYDSLYHGRIKDRIKVQICNILKSPKNSLKIKICKSQQQSNGVNNGLFAVANTYTILSGNDPSSINFSEDGMQPHL